MAIIMSIAYSCAKDPKLVRSNARKKYSYQNIISPQKASYNIKYREKHSGILKQAIVQYDSREFWPCFISIEERVKITDIKAKKDKYYFNTFHISLAIINPKSMKIRRSAHESANKISIISKKRYQYALNLRYYYQSNTLIPVTKLIIEEGKVHSSKVKQVPQLSIRFANKNSALSTRKSLRYAIARCRRELGPSH